ncbi:hypothetical protein [Geobacter argillaceus]|uniref:hypothetical protein n=1 Tax=Geobacter argillaceus TaxID=345631 RepID=UPI0011A268B8|nr:hypothetical protein [Geobacter argillaceus]
MNRKPDTEKVVKKETAEGKNPEEPRGVAALDGQSTHQPDDYEELSYCKSFVDSVDRGLADAYGGRTYPTEELREALAARRSGTPYIRNKPPL